MPLPRSRIFEPFRDFREDATWLSSAACEAVAIASSLGGPSALAQLLPQLRPDLPAPVLLAHHFGSNDPALLVGLLARSSPLPVRIAEQGERIAAGVLYIPPAGCHLLVSADRRFLTPLWRSSGHVCPSADLLFVSVSRVYGRGAVGIVLSGLGFDGAQGAAYLRRRGGLVIAQSESSAQHFDMPGAGIETRRVELVLPIEGMGSALDVLFGDPTLPAAIPVR